jgi:hypothetical protein
MRNTPTLCIVLIAAAACSSHARQSQRVAEKAIDSIQTQDTQSDTVDRILDAYYKRRITADSAVVALDRVLAPRHRSLNMEVDSALRAALLRHMKAHAESSSGSHH